MAHEDESAFGFSAYTLNTHLHPAIVEVMSFVESKTPPTQDVTELKCFQR
jgi:hypothetical protein